MSREIDIGFFWGDECGKLFRGNEHGHLFSCFVCFPVWQPKTSFLFSKSSYLDREVSISLSNLMMCGKMYKFPLAKLRFFLELMKFHIVVVYIYIYIFSYCSIHLSDFFILYSYSTCCVSGCPKTSILCSKS